MRTVRNGDFFGSILKIITLFFIVGFVIVYVIPNLSALAVMAIWTATMGAIWLYRTLDNGSPDR